MRFRRLLISVLAATVAAIVLMAATQFLLLSFESDPLFSRGRVDDVVSWIDRPPRVGAAMLAGIALLVLSLLGAYSMLRSFGTDRRVVTTRRRSGWTKFDRSTLEDALERRLEAVDRRNDVAATINSRGRVNLKITTPDVSAVGPVQELRDVVDQFCLERSLPCRSGRIVASMPRRLTKRRKIR